MTLPIAGMTRPPSSLDSPPDMPSVAAASSRGPLRLVGKRVVVVDDEEDGRELVAMILTEAGAEVRAVGSSEAGLQCLRSAPADLVLADIAMPGEDGHSFMRRVRALDGSARTPPTVPAVALTAYATGEDRARALRAGFDDFLAKPVHPKALVALVARRAKYLALGGNRPRNTRRGRASASTDTVAPPYSMCDSRKVFRCL